MRSKLAAALVSIGLAGSALAVSAAPAQANHDCVSRADYRWYWEGASIDRTARYWGPKGIQTWRGYGYQDREYPACTGGSVTVTFQWNSNRQQWVSRYWWADWY